MRDLMVDCETLGVGPFPALLSIGAVVFDPKAETVPPIGELGTFFQQVDPASCIALGASVETSTLAWWLAEPEAQKFILDDEAMAPVAAAMVRLIGWIENYRPEHIWSHGLLADARWLEAYAARLGVTWPFSYRAARDTRTLFAVAEARIRESIPEPRVGTLHHPTCDSISQARRVQIAMRTLLT